MRIIVLIILCLFLTDKAQTQNYSLHAQQDRYLIYWLEGPKDQIPVCFGGTSKIKWPFSNGANLNDVSDGGHSSINVSTVETVEAIVQPNSTCLVEIKVVSKNSIFKYKNKLMVGRYHSLKLKEPFYSQNFDITMRCVISGSAMAVENNIDKIYGFQFHPESFLTINGNLLIKKILSA